MMTQLNKLNQVILISLGVLFLDQGSKQWARWQLADESRSILGLGFARLELTLNPGAAWGINWEMPLFYIGFAFCMLLVMAAYLMHDKSWTLTRISRIGFGLIAGGIMGNMVDRIMWQRVTDFVVIGQFPVFNLADAALTCGFVALLVSQHLDHQQSRQPIKRGVI